MKKVGYKDTNTANQTVMESKKAKAVMQNLIVKPSRTDTADIGNWKTAVNQFKQGNRIPLYNLLDNLMSDPVLADAIDKLTGAVTNAEIMFQKDGKSVDIIDDMIDTPEFERMLEEIALKFAWGKSVFETGFTPGFSVFPFPRKNIRVTNLDKPLSERKKFIALKESDRDGYDYTKDEFIIECGDDDDMGFLFRAAQYVIYKRGGFGDWAQFVEIFGMPFITGEYEGFDENTRDMLFKALEMIGGNTRIAAPKGSNIQVTPNGSNGSADLYKSFTDACDRQILIAVLGNTMTTIEGSSRAQSKTHMETQEQRFKRVRRYTQRILNKHFIPLLIKRGYDVAGGFFSFPDAGETISTKDRVDMALTMRDKGLPVDDDYIFEISGVAKANNSGKEKKTEEKPEPGSKPAEKNGTGAKEEKLSEDRNFLLRIWDNTVGHFFADAPTSWSGAYRNWSRNWKRRITGKVILDDGYTIDIDKLIKEAIEEVYGSKGSKALVNKHLFDITNNALQHGIDSQLEDNVTDKEFIRQFKENAAVFSAFKNHQQTNLFVKALYDDDGKLRSFRRFRKECLKIGEKFNDQYLQTEYNTAVRAARMAANLKKYEKTAHLYPNLEYMETLASHPRESHLEYVGTILPIGHEAWAWLMPPSDWNCDCWVRPTDKEPTAAPGKPEDFNPIFDNNPAQTAEFVNTKQTPYYRHTDESLRDKVEKEGKKLFKEYKKQAAEHRKEVTEVYKGKNGGMLEIVRQQGQEREKNKATYRLLADDGGRYTLLSPVNANQVKNPDAFNYVKGVYSDAKHPVTDIGKNAIQRSIRDANRQGVAEVVIRLEKDYPSKDLYDGFKAAVQDNRVKNVKTIILLRNGRKPLYFGVAKLIKRFTLK
ncbi:MAG: DUF935 family protein [Dysgonomonas sp.]|uniref:phage portal protein family protein n=1 Tax=Dysgonomonas sp. TaxID=1891233 RepID=UPI003A86DCAC